MAGKPASLMQRGESARLQARENAEQGNQSENWR